MYPVFNGLVLNLLNKIADTATTAAWQRFNTDACSFGRIRIQQNPDTHPAKIGCVSGFYCVRRELGLFFETISFISKSSAFRTGHPDYLYFFKSDSSQSLQQGGAGCKDNSDFRNLVRTELFGTVYPFARKRKAKCPQITQIDTFAH